MKTATMVTWQPGQIELWDMFTGCVTPDGPAYELAAAAVMCGWLETVIQVEQDAPDKSEENRRAVTAFARAFWDMLHEVLGVESGPRTARWLIDRMAKDRTTKRGYQRLRFIATHLLPVVRDYKRRLRGGAL